MKSFATFLFAMAMASLPAISWSDTDLAEYYVELGPQDFYNSSGKRLTSGAAIFQQDRANVHRFGIRHGGDSLDPFFASRANRARIPQLFTDPNNRRWLDDIARMNPETAARRGFADYVVIICGNGNTITRLILDYADGDARSSC
ncbi:hypothetical protein [Primorskyibacter sp. S187A]|uniref:hypothetical protein n=1 Tax=Primorskyibacter sp. S187A TaxID=3415130 RepID=UPI003C7A257E